MVWSGGRVFVIYQDDTAHGYIELPFDATADLFDTLGVVYNFDPRREWIVFRYCLYHQIAARGGAVRRHRSARVSTAIELGP